jgi:hypothetical protein
MMLSMLWGGAQDYAVAFDVARIFRVLKFDILLGCLGSSSRKPAQQALPPQGLRLLDDARLTREAG